MKRALLTAISAFQLFSVSAFGLTYAEWISGYPSLTGGNATETADPDGDCFVNLMEFALDGFDPTANNSASSSISLPKVYFVLRDQDGTYGAPVTSFTTAQADASASLHMVIRYKPRSDVTGLRYVPQTNSKDLNHWGFGDSAILEWDADGYRWARSLSNMDVWARRAFMRLRVEVIE